MSSNHIFKPNQITLGLLLMAALLNNADAQPLDDVSLVMQEKGVVATVKLTGPVHYLRHFPESHGKTLEIYYDRVQDATAAEAWVDNEVRKSPPSGLIPSFTVTTRDQGTKPKLVIEFAREAEYSVTAGKDNRSLLITIQPSKRPVSSGPLPLLPTIKPEPAAAAAGTLTPDAAALADINKQARALMVAGSEALAAKNNETAVDTFNKLLLLPPNDYTQDGQEWVGVARERAKQLNQAKVEYELYLRLYPEGDGAGQVAQRLAGLTAQAGSSQTSNQGITDSGERKQQARLMSFGSVSTRYYNSNSTIDSTYTLNGTPTSTKLSLTDQSMLISTVDASERYVSEDYDGRLVFRDVNTKNFLTNQPSMNRVNAAYGEIKNRKQDYSMRVGRQSSMGGGVLGRFDGIAGGYGNAQELRVNGVAGALSDYSVGSKPTFYGASVDMGAVSLYGINQNLEGMIDRRAVGTEWRYFKDKKSAYALLDYDVNFKALNAAQFMGTAGLSAMNLTFMVDHRKTPSLSIRNALNGAGSSSLNALLQTMSASSLRDLAMSRTATSNMAQVGLTLPFKEKFQVGGDVRLANTSGLPQSGQTTDPITGLPQTQCTGTQTTQGCIAAQPGRGTEMIFTGQIVGSGLLQEGDIWSASSSYNKGNAVSGHSIYLYNHHLFGRGFTLDTSLQLYNQTDQFGGTTQRMSPMLRGAYRLKDQLSLEMDAGYESIDYTGPALALGSSTNTKTTRVFYSAGLRWDF